TDACDPMTGVSHTPIVCDDANACTADSCNTMSGCVFKSNIFFTETFANNNQGWSLAGSWQIGPAMLSSGQTTGFGTDPAEDHTPTTDNGIAGVLIGGNLPKVLVPFTYLTSPLIDLSGAVGPVYLEFWRVLNSDYPPYM